MNIAPTSAVNIGGFVFILAQLLGFDLPYTTEQVELAFVIFGAMGIQLFTWFRQWWTGRATVLGGRGPAAE